MLHLALRPAYWIIGLVFDALLAIAIVSFGSLRGIIFQISAVAITTRTVRNTDNVAIGIACIVLMFIWIAIETRNDEDMQADIAKYRKRLRTLLWARP